MAARDTPFDQGLASIKLVETKPNPFPAGSVQHDNYERGRQYGLSKGQDEFRPAFFAASRSRAPDRTESRVALADLTVRPIRPIANRI